MAHQLQCPLVMNATLMNEGLEMAWSAQVEAWENLESDILFGRDDNTYAAFEMHCDAEKLAGLVKMMRRGW